MSTIILVILNSAGVSAYDSSGVSKKLSTLELKVPIAKMRVFEISRLYLFNAIPQFVLNFPGNPPRRAVPFCFKSVSRAAGRLLRQTQDTAQSFLLQLFRLQAACEIQ